MEKKVARLERRTQEAIHTLIREWLTNMCGTDIITGVFVGQRLATQKGDSDDIVGAMKAQEKDHQADSDSGSENWNCTWTGAAFWDIQSVRDYGFFNKYSAASWFSWSTLHYSNTKFSRGLDLYGNATCNLARFLHPMSCHSSEGNWNVKCCVLREPSLRFQITHKEIFPPQAVS